MRRIIASSRYNILLAVICAIVAALTLFVVARIESFQPVIRTINANIDGKTVKLLAVSFIEIIDILLFGSVSYITALGLSELFIDEHLTSPAWLHFTQMDDLKAELIGVL
jgi:uncharacterized membrane protein YqhA